ncbi:MAG: hypothetical protein JWO10_693, partial [Microbacteriaceae bacterium]|nr:hypothetical protein [Microbacteriaceae bacterium]
MACIHFRDSPTRAEIVVYAAYME